MTVALAVEQPDGSVLLCSDTGTVLGDTVVQADDKVLTTKVDGVPLTVVLAGAGDGLAAAEAWVARPPAARGREAARGLQRLGRALSRIANRFDAESDSDLEALVVVPGEYPVESNDPRVYVFAEGGLTGPTEIGAIGAGATGALVAFQALRAHTSLSPSEAIAAALRACYHHCDGVMGGPGKVRVV